MMNDQIEICGVRVRVAAKMGERMRGLLGSPKLKSGEGLLILHCNAIHTCFMRYPIDVQFLDRENRVVKTVRNIRPWRFFVWGGFKAVSALETASQPT